MRTLILALSPLLMAGPALGQQTPICDLLKTAIAGNAVINGAAPKVTPANLAWPTGKTSVGGGRYSVVLFEGSPNAADVARMQQALAAADRQVGQCLPTARRTIAPAGATDKEIRYCVAGAGRNISLASSQGGKFVSALLTIDASPTKVCQ
ncbi:MAG: hypothetical protein U1E21_21155 [Reyranellaceae bacterium]